MTIYCGQLGTIIEFSYCILSNDGLPCRNAIGCWKERLDIVTIIRAKFGEEAIKKECNAVPISRFQRIVESIDTARRSK
jgi:hypothetical protein